MWWFAAAVAGTVVLDGELTDASYVQVSVARESGEQVCRRLVRLRSDLSVEGADGGWTVGLVASDAPDNVCVRILEGRTLLGPVTGPVAVTVDEGDVAVMQAVPLVQALETTGKPLALDAVVPADLLVRVSKGGRGAPCEVAIEAAVDDARGRIDLELVPQLDGRCGKGQAWFGWTRLGVDRGRWSLRTRKGARLDEAAWVAPAESLAVHQPAREEE